MQENLEIIAPDTPDKPRKYRRNDVVPLEDIIEYRNKGLTLQEIADLTGRCKQTIHERLETAGYNPERLKNFTKNRADMFAHIQSQLLNSLTPEAINAMLPHHRVLSSAILFDKERLERGKSTSNVSVVEIQGSIEDLRRQAESIRSTL